MAEIDYKINASEPIVDAEGRPTLKFQRKWQKMVEQLADHETRITALEP